VKLAAHFRDHTLILRLAFSAVIGIAAAGLLTWLMFALIQFSTQKVDESARVHILDFVRVKRQEQSVQREARAERLQRSDAPPLPDVAALADTQSGVDAIAVTDMSVTQDVQVDMGTGIGMGANEGEYLPIVKVAPIYPVSAASRGIEGECIVEYTVTANGSTRDIRVVEERCPQREFRKPSLAAAARFKYKPRIINGEAVEVVGVQNLFVYNLKAPEDE
jgi:periplasmic protein TonB